MDPESSVSRSVRSLKGSGKLPPVKIVLINRHGEKIDPDSETTQAVEIWESDSKIFGARAAVDFITNAIERFPETGLWPVASSGAVETNEAGVSTYLFDHYYDDQLDLFRGQEWSLARKGLNQTVSDRVQLGEFGLFLFPTTSPLAVALGFTPVDPAQLSPLKGFPFAPVMFAQNVTTFVGVDDPERIPSPELIARIKRATFDDDQDVPFIPESRVATFIWND
jgi:hypothetical protein